MRSPTRSRWAICLLCLAAGVTQATNPTGVTVPAPAAGTLTARDIAAAVTAVGKDPNLGGETHVRTLRWVKSDRNEVPASPPPSWLVDLFDFFGSVGGLALWVVGTVVVALTAVWIYRVARTHGPSLPPPAATATVMRVGELDIRPASLPADIAAAAMERLAEGRVREALSLLYRGALSRAVHRHGVAIGASFTEGEALGAVTRTLDASVAGYFTNLVTVWRRAVYAHESIEAETIRGLCGDFGTILGGPTP